MTQIERSSESSRGVVTAYLVTPDWDAVDCATFESNRTTSVLASLLVAKFWLMTTTDDIFSTLALL